MRRKAEGFFGYRRLLGTRRSSLEEQKTELGLRGLTGWTGF
jgi:hypothetical protein